MSRNTPTNTDDMIDLDSVRERIEELESERSDLVDAVKEASEIYASGPDEDDGSNAAEQLREAEADAKEELDDWDHDNGKELKDLTDFMSEAGGLDGPMIRESYFQTYAMELAEEIGAIPKDASWASWPANCIDWEQAARELQMDYTGADFDGVTYYGR